MHLRQLNHRIHLPVSLRPVPPDSLLPFQDHWQVHRHRLALHQNLHCRSQHRFVRFCQRYHPCLHRLRCQLRNYLHHHLRLH